MNAIAMRTDSPLMPETMDQAIRLAEMMARGKMMPQHLQGSPGDCLMVVEQAMRWKMSPFAVAQNTFSIKGKLLFAGVLVHAAIEASHAIERLIDYQYFGDGAARGIRVIATRKGEAEPRQVEVLLKDAKTTNENWTKQPDQQLAYHGVRVWGRRWTPGVMLGVYTPEEWKEQTEAPKEEYAGVTIEPDPEPKPLTRNEWLAGLEADLRGAQTPEAVDGILARDDVQKAQDRFTNGHKARLDELVNAAIARTAPVVEVDGFPGDVP